MTSGAYVRKYETEVTCECGAKFKTSDITQGRCPACRIKRRRKSEPTQAQVITDGRLIRFEQYRLTLSMDERIALDQMVENVQKIIKAKQNVDFSKAAAQELIMALCEFIGKKTS